MKKLNSTQWLQLLLIVALVVNALIHFSSPSYRYYKSNIEDIKKGVHDFERQVKVDFVPAILNLASNRVFVSSPSVVSNSFSIGQNVSFPTNDVSASLFNLDYHYFFAGDRAGFHFDGHDYFSGDSFFGSNIRVITPTVVITDSYHFVKPLLRKFSLDSDVHPVNDLVSNSVVSNNPSHVVRMLDDVYSPSSED